MITTPVFIVHRVSYYCGNRPRLAVLDQLILASPSQGHATIKLCTPPTTEQVSGPEGKEREKPQDEGQQTVTHDGGQQAMTQNGGQQTVTPGQEGAEKTTPSPSSEPPVTTDDASLSATTEGSSVRGTVRHFLGVR